MWLFVALLPYIQLFFFVMFAFGLGKYLIRNKLLFIYPGMKHPKATKTEYFLAGIGFALFTLSMIIRGGLGV